MDFTYTQIRVRRASWPTLSASLSADAWGAWRGEIGWYSDEGAVMSALAPEGVEILSTERLVPTVRPTSDVAVSGDGVWAHRWFEIDPSNLDEFVELSAGAWPQFESAHDGTQVFGLFHSQDDPSRLLLVTRYASLAMWEQSRPYNPSPTEGTDQARANFMRRAELTRRTIVRVGRLLTP